MKFSSLLLLPSLTTALWSPSRDDTISTSDEDLSIPGSNPLKFCESPETANHILRIKNVDLTPNPPQAGQTLTIEATGNFTKEVVEGAYINLVVKLGLITLLRRREDLCEQMKEVDKECPLVGENSVKRDVDLPGAIPPGKFVVQADVFTKDDEKITCLKAEIQFNKKGAVVVEKQKALIGEDDGSLDL